MVFKVSQLKRARKQHFTLPALAEELARERERRTLTPEVEEEEEVMAVEKKEEEVMAVEKKEGKVASLFQPLVLPQLDIDEEGQQEEAAEEEEEEPEKTPELAEAPDKKLTDADIAFRSLPLEDGFQLPPLSYLDKNGQLNSFLQHNLWWAAPAALDELVIQNPQRLSARDDKQFEAMIRVAEQAPNSARSNDPGSISTSMRKKLEKSDTEMEFLSKTAHRRVKDKIAQPASITEPPFDADSVKLTHISKKRVFEQLQQYHQPQLARTLERSFLQSLDKRLLQLPEPEQPFNKESARQQLTSYIEDLNALEFMDWFLLRPELQEIELRVREEDELVSDLHFIQLDSTANPLWLPVAQTLQQQQGVITPELWEQVVLTAVSTGSLPWEGRYWSLQLSELLLRYMQLALTLFQLYEDVVSHVMSQVEEEVSAGELPASRRRSQMEERVAQRVVPFVLAVRLEPYPMSVGEDKLDELVLNAFYGVEHDDSGAISPITQDAEEEESEEEEPSTESMRLLPLFEPDLQPALIEQATESGAASFDRQNYTAGSYNYVTKLLISRRQADVLGSSNLDQKVLRFRGELVAALERYREVHKREPLLQARSTPAFIGHDINTIICSVATHLRTAQQVDASALLQAAAAAIPVQQTESHRSKRVSEFLFYFALAEKMFLFEDGYLERPAREEKKEKKQPTRRQKRVLQFMELEAEEVEEAEEERLGPGGEEEEVAELTPQVRRSLLEKRLLRVAAELYSATNTLARLDRETPAPVGVTPARILQHQYRRGLNVIRAATSQELTRYEELWRNIKSNRALIAKQGGWPVRLPPQRPGQEEATQTIILSDDGSMLDSIPFVQDLAAGGELTQSALQNAFYAAVSVRDLMKRGRAALPDAPQQLSTPFPLIVERGRGTDIKERALRVAHHFLESGYLLPSNADSLAAGLTLLQLMRLLRSQGEPLSSSLMLELLTPLLDRSFQPTVVVNTQHTACGLTAATIQHDPALFQIYLYYGSVQDIRIAGVLALQLDYWMLPAEATAVTDDIKTELVQELLLRLLNKTQIAAYNEAVMAVNEVVREKSGQPPLLRSIKEIVTEQELPVYDVSTEEEYESLSLEDLKAQLAEGLVVYTPWLSSESTLRFYLEEKRAALPAAASFQSLCDFIDAAAGDTLNLYYRHSGCERDVIVDMKSDDGLNPLTFQLLEQHSLLYDGESYDTKLEAVVAYFSMTAHTILALDKLDKKELSEPQKLVWSKLVAALQAKPKPQTVQEAEALLEQVLEELSVKDRTSLTASLQLQAQAGLRELQVGSDERLHQARAAKRPYEGYILLHQRSNLEGELVPAYTPVYPKYRRMLQRLLQAVKKAERDKTHWLEEWSVQYRPRVLLSMQEKEPGKWVPVGRSVESALTMKEILGVRRFEGVRDLFTEPPLRLRKSGAGTDFYGYGQRSKDKEVLLYREQLQLITHLMELPPQFAGLGMLNFFIPDTRLASAYDPTHFGLAMDIMRSTSLLTNIAPKGVSAYIATHTPDQAASDVTAYAQSVAALFTAAQLDLKQGRADSEGVRRVAAIFGLTPRDPDLSDDIDDGLSDVKQLQGFVAALRYPFTQPTASADGFVVNRIIPEITESEPAVTLVRDGVYRASFVADRSSMTIPGPQGAAPARPRTRIIEEEEEETLPVQSSQDEDEVMEERSELSPELRELLESMEE